MKSLTFHTAHGMRGFFDQVVVAIDHANRTIHF